MRHHVEVAGGYGYLCCERRRFGGERADANAGEGDIAFLFFFNLIAQLINAHTLTPPPR